MYNAFKQLRRVKSLFLVLVWFSFFLPGISQAQTVPAELPKPDGQRGSVTKPVKVYILAGQSNMVGMGNLSGAKNIYQGMYVASDPAIPVGPLDIFKVGKFNIDKLSIFLPNGTPTEQAIAIGQFEVNRTGRYVLHCGHGPSSFCNVTVEGKSVYLRSPTKPPQFSEIDLREGQRYPFQISGYKQSPPRIWLEKTDLVGYGDLESVVKRDGRFPWLLDEKGQWSVRNDVYFQEARLAKDGKGSPLSATSNGKSIGPELGFGHVLGTFHDEQVLLIKTAQGNRSLGFDFRPPSSGRTDPANEFESAEYRLMIDGVRKTLDNIASIIPGYQGQGYQIAGFAWFQGHKDSFAEETIVKYEENLVNLIKDIRAEFKKPKLPVVVATVGFGGYEMQEKFQRILKAQMAVADSEKHPEFSGNVFSVDTRPFWREIDESPANQDYHYHRNAETYLLIGDALGRAMVGLVGGKAEPIAGGSRKSDKIISKGPVNPGSNSIHGQRALRPIILDGIVTAYSKNPRNAEQLKREFAGQPEAKPSQFLRGAMYGLMNCYEAAGIKDYHWTQFGPDLNAQKWHYFSFDPPEKLPVEKANRYRKVTFPKGTNDWVSQKFDPAKYGWKQGLQPFGQLDGKLMPLSESCNAPFCRCGEKPKTLWEKEVLMMRGTFEFPPLKKGHRYRIIVGGAAHVNSGEGYAIYLNGRLLAESPRGVAIRQGGQPRGAHIHADFRDEFNKGKVSIAAISFLRYNHPRQGVLPPRGHFSIGIEEQKLPPFSPGVPK